MLVNRQLIFMSSFSPKRTQNSPFLIFSMLVGKGWGRDGNNRGAHTGCRVGPPQQAVGALLAWWLLPVPCSACPVAKNVISEQAIATLVQN